MAVTAPGCDDAPIVTVERGPLQRPVTLIMPYYENPQQLASQLLRWADWRDDIRYCMRLIIVDDGSPEHPAEAVLKAATLPFHTRLLRIDVDVRWNWLAARNLAFYQAETPWCAVTDMDHKMPEETASGLVYGDHSFALIYRFSRTEWTGETLAPHPNSWFMTQAMFWRIGGYDEALSGYYGTDGEFRRRAAATAPIRILTDRLIREEFVRDSSTTHYQRKQPEDREAQRIIAARGPDWRPKVLSFPWHEISL